MRVPDISALQPLAQRAVGVARVRREAGRGGPLLGWAQSLSWALTISGIVLPMHLRGSLMPLHDTPVTDKMVHFMLFTFRRQQEGVDAVCVGADAAGVWVGVQML